MFDISIGWYVAAALYFLGMYATVEDMSDFEKWLEEEHGLRPHTGVKWANIILWPAAIVGNIFFTKKEEE